MHNMREAQRPRVAQSAGRSTPVDIRDGGQHAIGGGLCVKDTTVAGGAYKRMSLLPCLQGIAKHEGQRKKRLAIAPSVLWARPRPSRRNRRLALPDFGSIRRPSPT